LEAAGTHRQTTGADRRPEAGLPLNATVAVRAIGLRSNSRASPEPILGVRDIGKMSECGENVAFRVQFFAGQVGSQFHWAERRLAMEGASLRVGFPPGGVFG